MQDASPGGERRETGPAIDWGRAAATRVVLLLMAAIGVFGVMAAPLAWGEMYTFEDLSCFHIPLRVFYARCLATGQAFDWCPRLFCGFDLQGEGQVGMYHPLHLLLYRFLPFEAAFDLELLLCYPAAMLGGFLLLRRRSLPADAALLGGFCFAFAGFETFHYMHMNAVAVVAHIPFALLAIDGLLRAGTAAGRARAGALLAIVTGSQVLLGYPQYLMFSMIAEATYGAATWLEVRGRPRWLPALGFAMALGLGIGAVQLLPTRAALEHSLRAEPTPEYLATLSLPPRNAAIWLVPYLYESRSFAPAEELAPGLKLGPATSPLDARVKEYGVYNGAAVPVLVLWILLRFRRLGRRGLAAWALGLAALSLGLSIGDYSPFFELLCKVPGFDLFRAPSRFIALGHLATAVLMALAVADLGALRGRIAWRRLWPLALPPLGSLAIVIAAKRDPISWLGEQQAGDGLLIASIALVAAASALVAAAARGRRYALAALVGLIAIDAGLYSTTYLGYGTRTNTAILAACHPDSTGDPSARVVLGPGLMAYDNLWMFNGRGLVDGYVGLTPRRWLDYSTPAALRVASVGLSIGTTSEPLPGALPRARLVGQALPSVNPQADLDRIDPAAVVLLDQQVPLGLGPPGQAAIARDEPGEIRVVTAAPSRQCLVLSERFHPGWTVQVDGERRRVLRAYGDFMAVAVPPGRHYVEFRYEPASLVIGRAASLASLAAVLAWPALVWVTSRRRSRAVARPALALPAPHFDGLPALTRTHAEEAGRS